MPTVTDEVEDTEVDELSEVSPSLTAHNNQQRSRGRGRPVTNRTKLGRLINARHVRIYHVGSACGISPRIMTEYIQARRIIPQDHLQSLCLFFEVNASDIVEDWLTESLTDSTGQPVSNPNQELIAKREAVFSAKETPTLDTDQPFAGGVAPQFIRPKAGE